MSKKRTTQWFGGGQVIEPETDVSTSVSEIIELIPALKVADFVGQPSSAIIEGIYLDFSIHRLLTTRFDALGFLVWVAAVGEGSEAPIQALDALSTETRFYTNKNIMMQFPLPVPAILGTSDLGLFIANDEIKTAHFEFSARRKLDRSSQVLAMTLNSDVSVVTRVFCQWRVLLSYD